MDNRIINILAKVPKDILIHCVLKMATKESELFIKEWEQYSRHIFDKNASTVLHSLANFHSAKLLVFNNPRKSNRGKSF